MLEVVVTERDEHVRRLIELTLGAAGYNASAISDLDALGALAAARDCPRVLILADWVIVACGPDLRAWLESCGKEGVRPALIVLSAVPEMLAADVCAALREAAIPVVPLPFDLDRLVATVAWAAARAEGTVSGDPAICPLVLVHGRVRAPYPPPAQPRPCPAGFTDEPQWGASAAPEHMARAASAIEHARSRLLTAIHPTFPDFSAM